MKLLDRNRDGKLQEQEVPERFRERLFDFLDSNGDGELDALKSWPPVVAASMASWNATSLGLKLK